MKGFFIVINRWVLTLSASTPSLSVKHLRVKVGGTKISTRNLKRNLAPLKSTSPSICECHNMFSIKGFCNKTTIYQKILSFILDCY